MSVPKSEMAKLKIKEIAEELRQSKDGLQARIDEALSARQAYEDSLLAIEKLTRSELNWIGDFMQESPDADDFITQFETNDLTFPN